MQASRQDKIIESKNVLVNVCVGGRVGGWCGVVFELFKYILKPDQMSLHVQ